MRRSLLLALTLIACPTPDTDTDVDSPVVYPPLATAAPMAGAAEGTLKLPVGTPLAGFTARCGCSGSFSKQDERDSAYTTAFTESTGVHIRPRIKAIWIDNGEDHLVMTKSDVIYSNDWFVDALTTRLEELTGRDLRGQVTHSANHNHSSYGTYSPHVGLFLGSDRFNLENFNRMVEQHAQVAFEAYEARTEAAIGVGWAKDWDPNNQVYSDRRGVNNDLVVWEDAGPEQGGKDPHMQVLRVDNAVSGDPIAIMMSWGMHPFVFGEDSPMATADATALVEEEVAESFDTPVVAMFMQTSGGDASVRGRDNGWARMETVGALARDAILDTWANTPVSADPITIETTSRAVDMDGDKVHVTRNGEVDWYYPTYEGDDDNYRSDGEVYDENGDIISPLDEWYTPYGAAFCGSGDFDFPVGGLPTEHPIYTSCMNVSLLTALVKAFFRLDDDQVALPLDGMHQTYTAASVLGPLPVRYADGSTDITDLLLGFFPGETVSMYNEQWRRRAKAELGHNNVIGFGYSMDHEGYLLIPEDWLLGEYEPDITFQGPLAGEYIMENVLEYAGNELATDVREGFDPSRGAFDYQDYELPTAQPDTSPDAGTRITNDELPEYFWVPEGFELDLTWPTEVQRVHDVLQIGWIGGDPGVDNPRVTLERQAEDGSWAPVRSRSGKIINEDHHDFGLGHTPDPLFPASATQTHYWWATWQTVAHIQDRPGLALGTYRLTVEGKRYIGGNNTWPWDTEPYTFSTEPFEVTPATLTLTDGGDGNLYVSLPGPADGFRMIDVDGRHKGDNPIRGDVTLSWTTTDGDMSETLDAGDPVDQRSSFVIPANAISVEVTDQYGNSGTLDF